MKTIHARNILRKYLLMTAVLLLFFAAGYRAFSLYNTYSSYKSEIVKIEENTDEKIHNVLRIIIQETNDVVEYKTKMDSVTLQMLMIESMDMPTIYDNIVKMKLDDEFIHVLDNVFDLTNIKDKTIITVGTKDHVIYCKSNVDSDKFDHIDTADKYVTWEEYYSYMDNPEVMKKACGDLVMNRADYVILRTDGYYPNNEYYTLDDIIQEYHNNGTTNMGEFYILTLGMITENGDIFGESDDIFMQHNPDVHKLYIYKAVSLENFIKNYEPILTSFNESMSAKIIEIRNTTEFTNALINIFLLTTSIIVLMIVIKSLDNENDELNIKIDNKPK